MKPGLILALCALAALPPFAAARAAGTPEQRAACEADAFRLCKEAIPDADKVEACLRGKMGEISVACQAQFRPVRETK